MERARKWVMIPADTEKTSAPIVECEKQENKSDGITANEINIIIKLAKAGLVDENGRLIDKKGSLISDSSLFDCLTKKNKAKHYNRYLELKATINGKQVVKQKEIARKPNHSNKRKLGWEWDDE